MSSRSYDRGGGRTSHSLVAYIAEETVPSRCILPRIITPAPSAGNRLYDPHLKGLFFKTRLRGVCHKKRQFSPWTPTHEKLDRVLTIISTRDA